MLRFSVSKKEQQKMCLSQEIGKTRVENNWLVFFLLFLLLLLCLYLIAVNSFTELGPKLLKVPRVNYLLNEVFSQDPLERYFSRQRH